MKRKSIIFFIIIVSIFILISSFVLIFINNKGKKFKSGNNTTSQEIVDYILNMSSYKATIDVEIKSNKNENKYKLKQTYKNEQENSQEVLEPNNIAGVKITRSGNTLKLENTELNLATIIENYEYTIDSSLDLSSFIRRLQIR